MFVVYCFVFIACSSYGLICLVDSAELNFNAKSLNVNTYQCAANVSHRPLNFKLRRIEKWFPELAWPQLDSFDTGQYVTDRVSPKCKSALEQLVVSLKIKSKSALRVFDANAKVRPGFVSKAHQNDFGFVGQCPKNSHQHCFMEISWPLEPYDENVNHLKLVSNGTWIDKINLLYNTFSYESQALLVCLPRDCSSHDIESIGQRFAIASGLPLKFNLKCDYLSDDAIREISMIRTISVTILVLIGTLVIAATASRLISPNISILLSIVRCLDIFENSSKLLQISSDAKKQKLSFIHGYRFLYTFYSLFMHVLCVITVSSRYTHAPNAHHFMNTQPATYRHYLISFGSIVIGVNFAIAGLLSYYAWHPILKAHNGKLNFLTFAMSRFLRTLPVITATLMIVFAYPVKLGTGPVYRITLNHILTTCAQNGWADQLAFSNFFNGNSIAFPHSWFLAADYQIYLSSYFVIILLYRRPKIGLILSGALIVTGIIAHGLVLKYFNTTYIWTTLISDMKRTVAETSVHHFATTTGISPYFVGLMLGYLVANEITLNPKIKLLPYLNVAMALTCIYIAAQLTHLTQPDNVTALLKYMIGPTIRTLLSTSTCILFYSCYNGFLPVATRFLSLRFFQVLGKLSYSTFMIHYLVLWYDLATMRQPTELGHYQLIYESAGFYATSIALGYLLHVFVEAPGLNLLKHVLVRDKNVGKKVV